MPPTTEGGNEDRLDEIERIVNDEVNWSAYVRAGLDPVSHEEIVWLVAEVKRLRRELADRA